MERFFHLATFPMHTVTVDAAEQGMKLVGFLARRLEGADPPFTQGELHRWIRTGQVRVNGGRSTPFARLREGDSVRVPPFASAAVRHVDGRAVISPEPGMNLGSGLTVLGVTPSVLALDKPAGLPTQSGTGHADSVAARLRHHFAGAPYIPAPAHRLDKNTSGVLLAGRSFEAQRRLHDRFAKPETDPAAGITKTYLAWVEGLWPWTQETTLEDYLVKGAGNDAPSQEIVRIAATNTGKYARSLVSPVRRLAESPSGPASLLRVTLHTGRTHQVRVQLASRGFPIVGDAKYGAKPNPRMLLHAHTVTISMDGESLCFSSLPSWAEPFGVAAPPA